MIKFSPSYVSADGTSSSSCASNSGENRSRGSPRCLNSIVSAMRPTRSTSFTIRNLRFTVSRVVQVMTEVANEQRLALAAEPKRGVQLRARFRRQHRLQEGDVTGRQVH